MIRLAVEDDEPAIRACAQAAYARYVPLIGREPAPMTADFAARIRSRDTHVALGADGRIVGFVVFHDSDDHVLLENVAVLPDTAGQGIGKALIRLVEATAKCRGFNFVKLYTNEKMVENILIYRHLGYEEYDRRMEDGFSRVYFRKAL